MVSAFQNAAPEAAGATSAVPENGESTALVADELLTDAAESSMFEPAPLPTSIATDEKQDTTKPAPSEEINVVSARLRS